MEKKLITHEIVSPGERKTIPLIYYNKDESPPRYSYKVNCHKHRRNFIDASVETIEHAEQYSKCMVVKNNDDIPIWIEVFEEDCNNK